MIIEFTGASGAGKTVIRDAVGQLMMREGCDVCSPLVALWGPRLARLQQQPRLTNLLLDAALLPEWVNLFRSSAAEQEQAFRSHCYRGIARTAGGKFDKLRLYRSCRRKLAIDRKLREDQFHNRLILVDEGIIHLAPMIHGRNRSSDFREDCQQFARCAPWPDVLVWVKAPPEVREARITQRQSHLPLPTGTIADRRRYLLNAEAMIAEAINAIAPHPFVISVENHQHDNQTLKHHAQRIAEKLTARRAAA